MGDQRVQLVTEQYAWGQLSQCGGQALGQGLEATLLSTQGPGPRAQGPGV